jgi:hypothetical protein
MKRNVLIILSALLILTGSAIRAEDVNTAAPSIFVENPAYEFATAIDGTQVIHEFMIQNKGRAALIIEKVKTD